MTLSNLLALVTVTILSGKYVTILDQDENVEKSIPLVYVVACTIPTIHFLWFIFFSNHKHFECWFSTFFQLSHRSLSFFRFFLNNFQSICFRYIFKICLQFEFWISSSKGYKRLHFFGFHLQENICKTLHLSGLVYKKMQGKIGTLHFRIPCPRNSKRLHFYRIPSTRKCNKFHFQEFAPSDFVSKKCMQTLQDAQIRIQHVENQYAKIWFQHAKILRIHQ